MESRRQIARWVGLAFALATPALLSGCATVAEFRKLERQVADLQRGGGGSAGPAQRERVADIAAQLDSVEQALARLAGRVEVAEHRAEEALSEARSARAEAASGVPRDAQPPESPEGPQATRKPGADGQPGAREAGGASEEVRAYRAAYGAWRDADAEACIDRFRNFLQTYPSSAHADDAAYWLADCYFKQGDYKTAVLRFDDVVAHYPSGNKAPDALFRQGEALLRLGPGYGKAAGKAFERVVKEYPDSARAGEAKKQLTLLGAG